MCVCARSRSRMDGSMCASVEYCSRGHSSPPPPLPPPLHPYNHCELSYRLRLFLTLLFLAFLVFHLSNHERGTIPPHERGRTPLRLPFADCQILPNLHLRNEISKGVKANVSGYHCRLSYGVRLPRQTYPRPRRIDPCLARKRRATSNCSFLFVLFLPRAGVSRERASAPGRACQGECSTTSQTLPNSYTVPPFFAEFFVPPGRETKSWSVDSFRML